VEVLEKTKTRAAVPSKEQNQEPNTHWDQEGHWMYLSHLFWVDAA